MEKLENEIVTVTILETYRDKNFIIIDNEVKLSREDIDWLKSFGLQIAVTLKSSLIVTTKQFTKKYGIPTGRLEKFNFYITKTGYILVDIS